jgi:hypothetical protein
MTGHRELELRILLTRSFANLWLIRMQVLGYLGIFTAIAFVLPLAGLEPGGGGLVAYLVGQYWLYHSLLKARGLLETTRYHYFAFVGLALALILPILFGLAAFALPGLFLVARWIAAPTYVVADGRGAFAAAGASWAAVRGHTGKLALAVVIMGLIVSAIGLVIGLVDGQVANLAAYRDAKPIDLIEVHFLPLLLLGLSTATYEMLGPQVSVIEEVFG